MGSSDRIKVLLDAKSPSVPDSTRGFVFVISIALLSSNVLTALFRISAPGRAVGLRR